MTKDEALKLALEALENSAIKHPQQIAPRDAAITAIREALAQPAAQAERQPLTDEQIEDAVIKHGGKWDGDHWTFEDADLHPFFRSIYDIKGLT